MYSCEDMSIIRATIINVVFSCLAELGSIADIFHHNACPFQFSSRCNNQFFMFVYCMFYQKGTICVNRKSTNTETHVDSSAFYI